MTGVAWKISREAVWLMADTMVSSSTVGCIAETSKIVPLLGANAMMVMVGSTYAYADLVHFLRVHFENHG